MINFEKVSAELPTSEQKEKEREYNPLNQLRRDFGPEAVYRNKKGEAVIDDPDLHALMQFYRNSIKEGSLLNIGAGATHQHYMAALEDKLSHITALDLSPKNIQLLHELQDGTAEKQDIESLKLLAEAVAKDPRCGKNRNAEQILKNIEKKTTAPDLSPDLIVGDMYELKKALGERKYDNILLAFSLFVANDGSDLQRLFDGIKDHLNPEGRLIISDFGDPEKGEIRFQDEDLETFSEDKPILDNYHTNFRLDKKFLRKTLEAAGLKKISITEKNVAAEGEESEHELMYMLAKAENGGI